MCKAKAFLFFLVLTYVSFPQTNPNDIIIQVNNHKIPEREFIERLNGLPLPGEYSIDEIKENLVCTLIAESILSFEAKKNKYDTASQYRLLSNQYLKEAMYEQWMDIEVRKPVKVTNEELKEAYSKFKLEKFAEYYTFSNPEEAKNCKDKLTSNRQVEEQPQYKKIEYGKSLESIENVIYSMKEGDISDPVLVDDIYYVFRLIKSSPHPKYSKENFTYWIPAIEKVIRDRKENTLLDIKFTSLMKGKEFTLNKEAFEFLFNKLSASLFKDNQPKYSKPEEIQQVLITEKIQPGNILNKPFVQFANGDEWSLKAFWNMLSVSPFPLNYKSPNELKQGLVEVIRRIILLESVSSEAFVKKYDNRSFVNYQNAMWSNNILVNAFINGCRRNVVVNRNELEDHFEKNKQKLIKPETRKIIPLVVKDRSLALSLLKQINDGEDIALLAKKYSLTKTGSDADSTGVFITEDYWGAVGKTAFKMKEGEVSDLIENRNSGYAIIKLLEIQPSAPFKFDEVKDKIYSYLEDLKLQKKINEVLLGAVKNFKINVNRDLVTKAEYLGGNMGIKKTHFPLRNLIPSIQLFDHKAKWYKENIIH